MMTSGARACDVSIYSSCWTNECIDCEDGKLVRSLLGDESAIQWKQWEVNSDSKHLQCQYKESCVGEVIDLIRKE